MVFKPPLFTTPSYLMHLGINHQRKYFRSWSNSKKKHGIIGLKGSSSNYHNGSWICEIICSSDIFCFKVQFNLSASSRFSKSTNVIYSGLYEGARKHMYSCSMQQKVYLLNSVAHGSLFLCTVQILIFQTFLITCCTIKFCHLSF